MIAKYEIRTKGKLFEKIGRKAKGLRSLETRIAWLPKLVLWLQASMKAILFC